MRILHVTAFHSSLTTGGTEFYIEGLKSAFQSVFQAENTVAVFSDLRPKETPEENVVYHSPNGTSEKDLNAFGVECQEILERIKPDFIVFHTVDNYEGMLAKCALSKGIPYAFILHAPYWLCYQRDRMFSCRRPCRKMFHPFLCSICSWRGGSNTAANWFKSVAGELLRLFGLRQTSRYFEIKKELGMKEFLVRNAKVCISLNQRDYECLLENGIRPERLHLLGTALAEETIERCKTNAQKKRTGCLKILCAGRYCDVKGTNILVEAAHALSPELPYQLDCFGVRDFNEPYVRRGIELAQWDSRIRILPMLPHEELLRKYAEYDIQCLPSTVYDNGPLALWEGAYSGCRIASSENLGQKKFVEEYGDVIHENTVHGWQEYLEQCVQNTEEIRAKKLDVFPQYNSMNTIAKQIKEWLIG